jgi:pimeloyl-ACP methyl ester carboxylesterase
VLVVGVGLGGWIAAEIAVKDPRGCRARHGQRRRRQDRRPRDPRHRRHLGADAGRVQRAGLFRSEGRRARLQDLPEAESLAAARNREAYARLCWSPYMHNPKLKGRLHRIRIPTLFLWGTATAS